jgi:hypothetical protein
MFWTHFKSSILVLPWLLLPLAVFVAFVVFVDPWIQDYGFALRRESQARFPADAGVEPDAELEYDEGLEYEGDEDFGDFAENVFEDDVIYIYRWLYASDCFALSTIIAIIVNFVFLLVIPCALGGFDSGKKRFEFYLGFFMNLAGLITLPLVYYLFYELDTTTFVILIALHTISFPATYIIGSRFVSPAYKKAFWFA